MLIQYEDDREDNIACAFAHVLTDVYHKSLTVPIAIARAKSRAEPRGTKSHY